MEVSLTSNQRLFTLLGSALNSFRMRGQEFQDSTLYITASQCLPAHLYYTPLLSTELRLVKLPFPIRMLQQWYDNLLKPR